MDSIVIFPGLNRVEFTGSSKPLKFVDAARNRDVCIVKFVNRYLQVSSDSIVMIVSRYLNHNDIDGVLRFLNDNNIKKIYFFIEDVVRIVYTSDSVDNDTINYLDSYVIEQYPDTVEAGEFNVVRSIIQRSRIDFELYYCEYNATILSNRYNLQIKYFDWYLASMPISLHRNERINYKFTYKLCCFNLRPEMFRYILCTLLYLEPNILLTLGHTFSYNDVIHNMHLPLDKFDPAIRMKIIEGCKSLSILQWDDIDLENPNPTHQDRNITAIKDSFVKLVCETRFCSQMPYFSEKTLKPIVVFRPFILMAPPGTLQLIRDLGFKTFDKWWDEGYDTILDHNQRFEAVYKLATYILDKTNDELTAMLHEMSDILKYNVAQLPNIQERMFEINN